MTSFSRGNQLEVEETSIARGLGEKDGEGLSEGNKKHGSHHPKGKYGIDSETNSREHPDRDDGNHHKKKNHNARHHPNNFMLAFGEKSGYHLHKGGPHGHPPMRRGGNPDYGRIGFSNPQQMDNDDKKVYYEGTVNVEFSADESAETSVKVHTVCKYDEESNQYKVMTSVVHIPGGDLLFQDGQQCDESTK